MLLLEWNCFDVTSIPYALLLEWNVFDATSILDALFSFTRLWTKRDGKYVF